MSLLKIQILERPHLIGVRLGHGTEAVSQKEIRVDKEWILHNNNKKQHEKGRTYLNTVL